MTEPAVIVLTLPYPPSANNLYATSGGRRVLSRLGKAYHESVVWICRQKLGPPKPITGPISLRIFLYPPDRRRRDISNCVKVIEDSLTDARVWNDDSQISHLEVRRCATDTPGHVEVRVAREVTGDNVAISGEHP